MLINRQDFNSIVVQAMQQADLTGPERLALSDWLDSNPSNAEIGSFRSCPATQAKLCNHNAEGASDAVVDFAYKYDDLMREYFSPQRRVHDVEIIG